MSAPTVSRRSWILSKVAIYRDSVYTGDAQVAQTDTGKIVTITDNPPARGWYRYAIAIRTVRRRRISVTILGKYYATPV